MGDAGDEPWIEAGIEAATAMLARDAQSRWNTTVHHGTGGGTFGGSAIVQFDSPDERFVVKLIRRNDAAADHPLNWRRELDVYRSQWLQDRLPDRITLPRCHASAVTDTAAVIVMEAVTFDDPAHRSVDWYGDLAVELGRFSGTTLDASEAPPWATRGFVAYEAEAAIETLPAMLEEPVPAIRELMEKWQPLLRQLGPAAGQLVADLNDQPSSLNHLDIFSRNAARIGDRYVAIDWAYAGIAPVGSDATAVLVISAIFGDVDMGDFDAFSDAVVSGFIRGLDQSGVDIPADQVRRCIDHEVTLRFARFLSQLHSIGNDVQTVIEAVSGRTFQDAFSGWLALADALAPYAERTLATVDT
jgi:hypothetical protein